MSSTRDKLEMSTKKYPSLASLIQRALAEEKIKGDLPDTTGHLSPPLSFCGMLLYC